MGIEFTAVAGGQRLARATGGRARRDHEALSLGGEARSGGRRGGRSLSGRRARRRFRPPRRVGRSDLPIDTVKRLTCDGSLITIVEDDDGTPLDVGRKRRTVSTALKRALWSRDRGCTFPGCHHNHYVDAHHIRHWADGGDTSVDNLDPALLAPSYAAARRPFQNSTRCDGASLRARGRARDPALRLSARGHARRARSRWITLPRKRG